jgi:hypothetical protein
MVDMVDDCLETYTLLFGETTMMPVVSHCPTATKKNGKRGRPCKYILDPSLAKFWVDTYREYGTVDEVFRVSREKGTPIKYRACRQTITGGIEWWNEWKSTPEGLAWQKTAKITN